jgi:hypothetical protein
MTTLQDLVKLRTDYETQLTEKGEEFIEDVLKKVYEYNPEIVAVRWQQYTPHVPFEGEPRVFHVGIDYVEVLYKGKEEFGDHVEIVATRERFEVTEYDHD